MVSFGLIQPITLFPACAGMNRRTGCLMTCGSAVPRMRGDDYASLKTGRLASWDHQPMVAASEQYMRNHIDLDDLERRGLFPVP